MKKKSFIFTRLLLIFSAIAFALAGTLYAEAQKLPSERIPAPSGYVNDFAGVIDAESSARMEQIIRAVKEKTGAEIAVVTVQTISPYQSIEEYTIKLATEWGVGKAGEDNGLVILVAMQERMIRIEVGYGLEGAIPDGLAGQIRDKSIVPDLREGRYGRGLLKGVEAVAGIIAKEYGVNLGDYDLGESAQYTRKISPGLVFFFIVLFIFIFFGAGRFLWPLLFFSGMTGGRFYRGGFGSGGFGSGGSSFGGFSGFGGGGFGGGGASGKF